MVKSLYSFRPILLSLNTLHPLNLLLLLFTCPLPLNQSLILMPVDQQYRFPYVPSRQKIDQPNKDSPDDREDKTHLEERLRDY